MNKFSTKSTTTHKYHAFISYRHADNKEQGRQWATWLHQAIETYEVPSELVGQDNGRGEMIPARIYPIFRDEEELPANSDLGKSIVGALDSTRLLIVLCSPRAVASTYVADEIDYFKKLGHSDRIIAAMIDGEPNTSWDKGKQSAGFKVDDECFPVPLQFEYDENGQQTKKHAEPIAADFRINNNGMVEQAWTSPEAYRQHLETVKEISQVEKEERVAEYQKQQHLMLLKIIAGILGVPLGELTQRDKEYQLELERVKAKKLKRWLAIVGLFAFIAVGAGFTAYLKQQEAIQQTKEAQVSQSKTVAQNAIDAFNRGEYESSIKLALSALPKSFVKPDRGYSSDAEAILSSAVYHDKLIYTGVGDELWDDYDSLRKHPYKNFVSNDESRLILYGEAAPIVIDLNDGKRVELKGLPKGRHWRSQVSSSGKFISAETLYQEEKTSYIWSTFDGQLKIKQAAEFSRFSGDEKFAGFHNKEKKKTNTKDVITNGFLINIDTGVRQKSFSGQFKRLDKDNDRLYIQENRNCGRRGLDWICDATTKVLSFKTDELILTLLGELIDTDMPDGQLMLKNSIDVEKTSDKTEKRDLSTWRIPSKQYGNGVALWDINLKQQLGFYHGYYRFFNSQFGRLITRDSHSQSSKLWDLSNHQMMREFKGEVISLNSFEEQKQLSDVLLFDWDEKPLFLVSVGDNLTKRTILYSLLEGELRSQSKGRYLGLSENNEVITVFESNGKHQLFRHDYEQPILIEVEQYCKSDGIYDSGIPLMSSVKSNVIIFNCGDFIATYHLNSATPNKPQIINSKRSAEWVLNGDLFWYGEDHANLMGFSYWEGGGVSVQQVMRVELEESIEFKSLLNGAFLLAQTPDSGISLWDSSGDIFKPVVTIDELEFEEVFLNNFDGTERMEQEVRINSKKKLISELAFDYLSLQQHIQFNQEESEEEYIDKRWSAKILFSEHTLSKIIDDEFDSVIEIQQARKAVLVSSDEIYLVDNKTGERLNLLYSGNNEAEEFFWHYEEPFGVSESPNDNAFILYNGYGVWLFDAKGEMIEILCDDPSTCNYPIEFEWIEDSESLFVMNQSPSIVYYNEDKQVDLCKSYDTKDDCRQALSGSILFSKYTIATGSAILDSTSGIRLLDLPGSLGGMFAHPWKFNADESAVLMVAETGGGTTLFGIWKLPQRGESLLTKARNKYAH